MKMTSRLSRARMVGASVCVVGSALTGTAFAATSNGASDSDVNTATGINTAKNCIENGYHYSPDASGLAVAQHCFATDDKSTRAPLATVDQSKTQADLDAVHNTSVLDPKNYLGANTFATAGIQDSPLASNSKDIAAFVANDLPQIYLPSNFSSWLRTGSNIGGGVNANDNIPIYTVDSSNPYENFQNFKSTDGRVTNFPQLQRITDGKIPLPSWAKTSDGGDHSFAIYDKATGIWRSYFDAAKNADGVWDYSASGYWYGDPNSFSANDRNYWLSLVQGSSSVIGISNELTQIGAQEVKDGVINHKVSVTFPNYMAGKVSFPAKQSDGQLDPTKYPNAPQAGQEFTFPADFDVDAYVKANNIDPTTAAIMRAVKKYGGIVSDRNSWCMAFNFENPYGIGSSASKGENLYKTDADLSSKINAMNINTFPWAQTAWVRPNDAGKPTASSPTSTATPTTTSSSPTSVSSSSSTTSSSPTTTSTPAPTSTIVAPTSAPTSPTSTHTSSPVTTPTPTTSSPTTISNSPTSTVVPTSVPTSPSSSPTSSTSTPAPSTSSKSTTPSTTPTSPSKPTQPSKPKHSAFVSWLVNLWSQLLKLFGLS